MNRKMLCLVIGFMVVFTATWSPLCSVVTLARNDASQEEIEEYYYILLVYLINGQYGADIDENSQKARAEFERDDNVRRMHEHVVGMTMNVLDSEYGEKYDKDLLPEATGIATENLKAQREEFINEFSKPLPDGITDETLKSVVGIYFSMIDQVMGEGDTAEMVSASASKKKESPSPKIDGIYTIDYEDYHGELDITAVSKNKIKFAVSGANSIGHTCDTDGTAVLKNNVYVYHDSDEDCSLTIAIKGKVAKVSTTCESSLFCGVGLSIIGEYEKVEQDPFGEILLTVAYGDSLKSWDTALLKDISKEDLRIMRNCVYARHGREFKSKDLNEYFYVALAHMFKKNPKYSDSMLTKVDKENIELIQKLEGSK